jgi:hypothetical protein
MRVGHWHRPGEEEEEMFSALIRYVQVQERRCARNKKEKGEKKRSRRPS